MGVFRETGLFCGEIAFNLLTCRFSHLVLFGAALSAWWITSTVQVVKQVDYIRTFHHTTTVNVTYALRLWWISSPIQIVEEIDYITPVDYTISITISTDSGFYNLALWKEVSGNIGHHI